MSQGVGWPRRVGRRREHETARWRSRRSIAFALRLVVLLAPVAVSVAASFAVTRLVPAPAGLGARALWFSGVILLCGLLAWPTRRALRRLLPLAALLELSILFPGEAPARWRVAREAGSIRHLELLAGGVPDTEPVRAATTILALVASLARHDRVTRGHSERVRVFTDMIAEEMGLPRFDRDRLRWAALIHDVGKLEVPAKLLRKPGKPTAAEWASLRLHPEVGARLVAPLSGWLGEYAAVVAQHHERFNGAGYPAGLRGDEISLGARIVGLADAFEVMTAARPYKKASSRAWALREVVRCSGSHFDPDVVRAFLAVSTPRLRRALGPASWVGQLPVVGTAPVGGLPAVAGTIARGAGTVVLGGMATAVVASSAAPAGVPVTSPGAHQGGHSVADGSDAGHRASTGTPSGAISGQPAGAPASGVSAPIVDGVASTLTGLPAPATSGAPAQSSPVAGSSSDGLGSGPAPAGSSESAGPVIDLPPDVSAPAQGAAAGGSVGDAVGGVVSGVGDTLGGAATGVGGAVGDTVGGVAEGVGGVIGGSLGSTVGDLGDAVGSTVGSTVGGLGDAVGSTVDTLGGTLAGLLGGGATPTPPTSPAPTTSPASAPPAAAPTPTPAPTAPSSGLGGLLGKLLGR